MSPPQPLLGLGSTVIMESGSEAIPVALEWCKHAGSMVDLIRLPQEVAWFFLSPRPSAMKKKNYSFLSGFYGKEWEQQCENHFVFWLQAQSHPATHYISEKRMSSLWRGREYKIRSTVSQTAMLTEEIVSISFYLIDFLTLFYHSEEFPHFSKKTIICRGSNVAKQSSFLVARIWKASCKIWGQRYDLMSIRPWF